MMQSKRTTLSVLGILLIAIAIRVFFLLLEVEVDAAYRDYRTLHAQTGEWRVENFFGGEGGALTIALGGIISFLNGPSLLNMRLASLVFFALFAVSTYFLGRETGGSRVGILGMLFVAIGSPFFTLWSVAGRGGVMDVLLLGNVLLILGVRFKKLSTINHQLVLAGVISGLGFLAGRMLICCYVIGIILLLRSKFFLRRNLLLYLLGFVLSSSPFWIYHFPEYGRVLGFPLHPAGLSLLHSLPRIFGLTPFGGLYSYPVLLIYVFSFLYYLWVVLKTVVAKLALLSMPSRPRLPDGGQVGNYARSDREFTGRSQPPNSESSYNVKQLFFLFLIILTVSCISGRASWEMLPVFSVFPILLSYAVLRTRRAFSYLLIFLIVIGNGRALVSAYQFRQVPQSVKINRQEYGLGELMSFLEAEEIRAVYTSAPVGFRLMSATGGEIVCSEPWVGISPRYTQAVDGSNRFAYVFKGERDTEKFARSLYLAGGEFRRERIHPGFTVFYDFQPPQPGMEITGSGWSTASDCNGKALPNIFDGIASTRWTTQRPQRPGMFLLVDMGKVEIVNGVSLLCSAERDCPKYFTLFTSVDEDKWEEIISMDRRYFPGVHWSGNHLFWEKRSGNLDVRFQSVNARYVKIVLKGLSRHFHWSVDEMFVYRPVERAEYLNDAEIVKLAERLIESGVKRVYGPELIMAKLAVASGGKLGTLWRYDRESVHNGFSRNVRFGEGTVFLLERRMANAQKEFSMMQELQGIPGCGIFRMPDESGNYKRMPGSCLIYEAVRTPDESLLDGISGRPGELSPEGWRADSNCAGEKTSKAFDRNWLTRWSSAKPQEPGIYYQLDLGRVHNLSEMVLNFAGSQYDYPRGFKLLTSVNGTDWEEVEAEVRFKPGYLWTGGHFLKASEEPDEMQIVFKRVRARFMKIVLTDRDPVYHWSIYEIQIYED